MLIILLIAYLFKLLYGVNTLRKGFKMIDKIKVGAVKDDLGYSGLFFADNLFEGIPKALRITDWHAKGKYDNDAKAYIDGTLATIKFKAYDQTVISTVEKLKNETLLKQVVAGQSLVTMRVDVPDDDTADYRELLKWVTNLDKLREQNLGKDMVFEKCECHVVPLPKSGTFGSFKGLELRLFNPTKVVVKFVDPLQI